MLKSVLEQLGGLAIGWILFIGFFIVFGGIIREINKRKMRVNMKQLSIIFILIIWLSSCLPTQTHQEKSFTIYWQDNNLCVVMPHPTMGIVTPGQIDWRGVELSEVVEDIYNEFQRTNLSGDVSVWVRFEMPEHDKYGNENVSYDDHFLTTIPISEAKKYQSGNYLDAEYSLKNRIIQSAFPRNSFSPNGTNIYYTPGDATPTTHPQTAVQVVPIAPTETIDLLDDDTETIDLFDDTLDLLVLYMKK